MPLFLDLLDNNIMASRTLKINKKYVPKVMLAKSIMKKKDLGWVDYCMHKGGKIC